jgi:hypothetical protein
MCFIRVANCMRCIMVPDQNCLVGLGLKRVSGCMGCRGCKGLSVPMRIGCIGCNSCVSGGLGGQGLCEPGCMQGAQGEASCVAGGRGWGDPLTGLHEPGCRVCIG